MSRTAKVTALMFLSVMVFPMRSPVGQASAATMRTSPAPTRQTGRTSLLPLDTPATTQVAGELVDQEIVDDRFAAGADVKGIHRVVCISPKPATGYKTSSIDSVMISTVRSNCSLPITIGGASRKTSPRRRLKSPRFWVAAWTLGPI